MEGVQNLKIHIEAMLEIVTKQIEQSQKQRLKPEADEYDRGHAFGSESALKTEKVHLTMLLGIVRNELEIVAEIENSTQQTESTR